MVRLELIEGKSQKFWEAKVVGKKLVVAWGRIGTKGQSKARTLSTTAAAKVEYAKLVASKKRKGYREASKHAGTGGNVSKPLVELAALLTRKDAPGLAKEVTLAVDQPDAYFRRWKERLSDRGVEGPTDTYQTTLPWLALIDGLAARKQLIEIDWREAPEDSLVWMSELRTGLLVKKDFGFMKDVQSMRADAFLKEAAKRFARAGARMVLLDMSSDSYPVAFHSVKDDAKVKKLAAACQKAGFGKLRPL
jgi:predicted DNA-binding WGR domain protein